MLCAAPHRTQYFIAWQEKHQRKSFILLSLTIMQEDINDVQLMMGIKIYTKKLYQNVIMYVIFVSKIVLTHKFFCSIYLNLHNKNQIVNPKEISKINIVIESSNRILVKYICYIN